MTCWAGFSAWETLGTGRALLDLLDEGTDDGRDVGSSKAMRISRAVASMSASLRATLAAEVLECRCEAIGEVEHGGQRTRVGWHWDGSPSRVSGRAGWVSGPVVPDRRPAYPRSAPSSALGHRHGLLRRQRSPFGTGHVEGVDGVETSAMETCADRTRTSESSRARPMRCSSPGASWARTSMTVASREPADATVARGGGATTPRRRG